MASVEVAVDKNGNQLLLVTGWGAEASKAKGLNMPRALSLGVKGSRCVSDQPHVIVMISALLSSSMLQCTRAVTSNRQLQHHYGH